MSSYRSAEQVRYPAGYTKWGQKLTLIGDRESNGEMSWTLHKDQLNQRDDSDTIRGLTAESIRKMMAAIEEHGK